MKRSPFSERIDEISQVDRDFGPDSALAREELTRKGALLSDSESEYYFLRGELLLAQEKLDEALEAFEKVKVPSSVTTKRIAQLAIRKGDLAGAILAIERYRESNDADFELLELLGGAYTASQKLPLAEKVYRELIQKSSGKAKEDATIYLVTTLAQLRQTEEAKSLLQEILRKNPKSGIALYYLAKMHEMAGELPSAEKVLRQAIRVSPENDGLSLELARVLAVQKKLDEAIDTVKNVVARSPQNQQARQILSQLLLSGNDLDAAVKELESLGAIDPGSVDTRLKIGLIKLERRDFEGAEKELRQVLVAQPENSPARYYLGLALAGQGRGTELVETILDIPPDDKFYVESRMLGAFLLRQNGRIDDALRLLENAEIDLRTKPDIRILNFLASLQKEAGRASDAVRTQRKVVELEPTKDTNFFMLAVLLQENGDFNESIEAGRKAIELNPKNADALNFVGYSLAEKGVSLGEAKELIARAIELEPQNGYFIDSLGWVFFQEERYEDARLHLERAAALASTDAVILEHLARVQERLGQNEEALQTARKALIEAPNSDDKEVGPRLQELIRRLERTFP